MRAAAGFTLVELLIGMTLTVLLGGVMYVFQSQGISAVNKGTTRLTLQSEVRRKLERLINDLRTAEEILDIDPNAIRFSRYIPGPEEASMGEDAVQIVKYSLERKGGKSVIFREEGNNPPEELLTADKIEDEMFFPYFEEEDTESETPGVLYKSFDMNANDSGERKRISFLRIRIKVRQNKEFVTVRTSLGLRVVHQRLAQPAWKAR